MTEVKAGRKLDQGDYISLENEHAAHNYHPLPVVVASGDGAWVTDVDGKRYLDCLAAYSAVNFGHSNPVLLDAARAQLGRITLTSRAFHNDQLGPFVAALAKLAGKDMVLPMNTGAEAVESAIKVARAWGYRVKGVAAGLANIVVAGENFHGRTTTIISFSDDESARKDFGPFTPGFRTVPYGDAAALEAAIDENTVAVLLEPIQGEAGIVVPPADYLPAVREITTRHNVLFIADEIQSGLGRTGATFACDLVSVVPDLYLLGKALLRRQPARSSGRARRRRVARHRRVPGTCARSRRPTARRTNGPDRPRGHRRARRRTLGRVRHRADPGLRPCGL